MRKCPHCNYMESKPHFDEDVDPNEEYGKEGKFFSSPVKLERENTSSYYKNVDSASLIGCPRCNKTFIHQY